MGDKSRTVRDKPGATIAAGPVAGTVLFALSRGISMEQITEATGLHPSELAALDGHIPEHYMPALWRLLGEAFPGRALALEMAAMIPMSFFGVLGSVARYAPTLRDALELFMRYRVVMSANLQIDVTDGPQHTRLQLHHPRDADDGGRGGELGIAVAARFVRDVLLVQDALIAVELRHAPFGPRADYERYFATPVRFEAPANAILFRSEALTKPLPDRDPTQLHYAKAHLDLVYARHTARSGHAALDEINAAIDDNAQRGEYGTEALAKQLGTTVRTLQRRVQAHGTTLRALIDSIREANARRLLANRKLSVAEVAFLLGYSTESSFRRAIKRWTGKSPQQLRS